MTGGSDDGFLYSRGFVVAIGREFYDAVAGDPGMGVASSDALYPLLRIGRYVAMLKPALRLRACTCNRLTRSRRHARR